MSKIQRSRKKQSFTINKILKNYTFILQCFFIFIFLWIILKLFQEQFMKFMIYGLLQISYCYK